MVKYYKRCNKCDEVKYKDYFIDIENDPLCTSCLDIKGEAKKCTKCRKIKSIDDFYGKDNKKMSWCKRCSCSQIVETRKRNPEKYRNYIRSTISQPNLIYSRKKANAKLCKIDFTISKEEFLSWYNQDLKCHYCSIRPEYFHLSQDKLLARKANLGIDRKNNDKGYSLDNIVLCCDRCNLIKSKFFTYEDMKFIGEKIVKLKWTKRGVEFN